ncbi:hypothetical protein CMK11_06155 [Candidatus Poribacteria bacterium]|nr:hypothetical protein [Candidatus Poribacteria bacterium]
MTDEGRRDMTPSPRVARMAERDVDAVLSASHVFTDHPDLDESAVQALLGDSRAYLMIGYVEDDPAGFALAYALPRIDARGAMLYLHEVDVLPGFRRMGVATALMDALLGICGEAGFSEMFVISNQSNQAAMRLYESTGGERPAADDVVFVYETG